MTERLDPEPGLSDPPLTDQAHKRRPDPAQIADLEVSRSVLGWLGALPDRLDRAVPLADDAGNRVLVDNAWAIRWAGPLFAVGSTILLPWIVLTAIILPAREVSRHYDLAWAGFDVMLFGALAATGVLALRRSRFLTVAAAINSAFLLADAWFDVTTARAGRDMMIAVSESVFVELPLAGVAIWLAIRNQQLAERRLVLLLRTELADQVPDGS